MQVPVQDIVCYPDVDLSNDPIAVDASNSTSGYNYTSDVADMGGVEFESAQLEEVTQPEEALAEELAGSPNQQFLSMPLGDLDLAAVEELVAHLIQMGGSEDPDADFFEDASESTQDQQPQEEEEEGRTEL